ncbi:MAG: polya polymerase [Acetatifactor sp.]|nr:polya polymerase [Acetatifactor sp.]
MHIKNNINIVNFLKQVQKCSADVLFVTPEGDRIALKSTLSQYIFCTIASNAALLQSGIICFKAEKDKKLLEDYLYD